MNNIKEADIKRDIKHYLTVNRFVVMPFNSVGIWDKKNNTYRTIGRKGISDILALSPKGKFIAIEAKLPSERKKVERIISGEIPRDKRGMTIRHQFDFIQDVIANNGIGFFAYSLDEVIIKLNKTGM